MRFKRATAVIACALAAALAVPILIYLLIDADDVVRFAKWRVKAETGRELIVEGPASLKKGLRPRLHAQGLSLDNAQWSKRPSMLTVKSLDVQVRLLSLFFGPIKVDELVVEEPRIFLEKNASGDPNWRITRKSEAAGDFPRFSVLRLVDGGLDFEDRSADRRFALAEVNLESRIARRGETRTTAYGKLEGDDFRATLVAAPFEELRAKEKPYRFDLSLSAGKLRFAAKGFANEPLALRRFEADAETAGPDLALLYKYTGLALPATPPYQARGRLIRNGDLWTFRDAHAVIGKSPIEGAASFHAGEARPRFSGDVRSRALRLVDIAGLFGLDPARFDPAAAKTEGEPAPILSDAPINLSKLNAMNADIRLVADTAVARNSVFDAVEAQISLKDGVLAFAPLNFSSGGGAVRMRVKLDATKPTAAVGVHAAVERMPLSRLLGDRELDEAAGPISGAASMTAAGASMKQFAETAAGTTVLYMEGGKVSHLMIELLGLDVAESLGIVLSEDEPIPVRCGVASFVATKGTLDAKTVFFDTTDTLVAAEGSIDLGEEAARLRLKPYPKDWSPFSLKTTIAVEGPLADLAIFPDPLKLGAKGVVKKAANAVVTTVIGLLPPVEIGEDKTVDCASALAAAKEAAPPAE